MNTLQEYSLLSAAGPFLWPLLLASTLTLFYLFERTHYLHKGQINARDFLEGIKNNLRQGRPVEALTVCEETPGPMPRIVKAILLHAGESEARMRVAAEGAALLEVPPLERRIGTIAAMAKLAPLLGLTGTVIALLKAFLAMRDQGHYATADAFAAHTVSALSTTALGLVIAIIAHLGCHFLQGRIRAIVHDMEWTAHNTIQFVCHELPAEKRPDLAIQHESA